MNWKISEVTSVARSLATAVRAEFIFEFPDLRETCTSLATLTGDPCHEVQEKRIRLYSKHCAEWAYFPERNRLQVESAQAARARHQRARNLPILPGWSVSVLREFLISAKAGRGPQPFTNSGLTPAAAESVLREFIISAKAGRGPHPFTNSGHTPAATESVLREFLIRKAA